MQAQKKVSKRIGYNIGRIVTFAVIVLIIIRINSSGEEESFRDENGEVAVNGIAMHETIDINGVPQRNTMRGRDVGNHALLRVHGGSGSAVPPVNPGINGFDLIDLSTPCY